LGYCSACFWILFRICINRKSWKRAEIWC